MKVLLVTRCNCFRLFEIPHKDTARIKVPLPSKTHLLIVPNEDPGPMRFRIFERTHRESPEGYPVFYEVDEETNGSAEGA